MLKRKLSLVLAIVMAVGMLLGFAGCKVSSVPLDYRKVYDNYDSSLELQKDRMIYTDDNGEQYTFNIVEDSLNLEYGDYDLWLDFFIFMVLRHDEVLTGKITREIPGGGYDVGTFKIERCSEGVHMYLSGYSYYLTLETELLGKVYLTNECN